MVTIPNFTVTIPWVHSHNNFHTIPSFIVTIPNFTATIPWFTITIIDHSKSINRRN